MPASLAPQWIIQALTDAGAVASGAKLYSFIAGGGSVPSPLLGEDGVTPLANPYTFNSAGRAKFLLDDSISYRLRLETAAGDLIEERDNVGGAATALGWVRKSDLANAANDALGAGMVGYEGRAVSTRLKDFLSVKDFGAAGDGVQDDTAEIQAAIIAAAGRTLWFPAGTYNITGSGNILPLANVALVGEGRGRTILSFVSASSFPNIMQITGDSVRVSHLTLKVDVGANGALGINFTASSTGHEFLDFEIDGSQSVVAPYANSCHGVLVEDAVTVTKVNWTDCHIHGCGYGTFTRNSFDGLAQDWSYKGCHFYSNYYDDLELNSANNTGITWQRIDINGCFFSGWLGNPATGTGGFAVGIDSGKEINIHHCHFDGYETQAVHIEYYTQKITVDANTFTNCKVAVATYFDNSDSIVISNNTIDGRLATTMGDDPSTYSAPPGLVAGINVGIYVLLPGGSSSSRSIRIFGNTITRCQYGIVAPINRGGYVNDNQIQNCIVAINVPVSDVSRVYNNRAVLCKYLFEASRLVVGHNTAEDCYQLFYGKSDIYFFQDGFRWIQSAFNLPASSTTGYILCDAPERISNGKMRFFARKNGGGGSVMVASSIEYDGATLTGTKDRELSVGAFSTSGSGLRINAGNLELVMFSAFGFNSTFNLDTDIRGAFMWA